jgi:aspartate aminotransferase-like enzyme
MIHHRTPEFARELATVVELLLPIFGTAERVLPIHATGRGALEAAVCNLFSAGDEIAVCCNGKFGEMWAGFAESYGVIVHRISTNWEQSVDPATVDAFLAEHSRVRAVALAYADTSTGVANDIAGVARIANARGVMTLVDGVSSIGGMPFDFDEWGVDVAVTATQKCLMSSPGMAFVVTSERARRAEQASTLPKNYWSFAAVRSEISKAKPETPGTTPVHIVLQVAEALRMIHEEGFDRVVARHRAMAERARARVEELSLELQCPSLRERSTTMTAISLPAGLTPSDIRGALKSRGILTAAGLGRYQPTSFRIGHMGDIRMSDVDRTLDALRDVLTAKPVLA